jgi:hypothetical protein
MFSLFPFAGHQYGHGRGPGVIEFFRPPGHQNPEVIPADRIGSGHIEYVRQVARRDLQ